MLPAPVHGQSAGSWEAGGQVSFLNEAADNEVGIGGRVGRRLSDAVAIEGIVNAYLSNSDDVLRGGRKLHALVGPTVIFRSGGLGLFGKVRVGFARIGEGKGEGVCIAIFPPPGSCFTADTRAAFDLGGGFEVRATPTVVLRVEAGDVMTRGGRRSDLNERGKFTHDLEIAAGIGVRF